eukprot:GFYU01006944.1.p1 GENE.GFYU01006944.1~~GFYU01006944.1.p1  ORF type:complete len:357 (+),score=107.36 GFYU01006944.1:80-1072(+)
MVDGHHHHPHGVQVYPTMTDMEAYHADQRYHIPPGSFDVAQQHHHLLQHPAALHSQHVETMDHMKHAEAEGEQVRVPSQKVRKSKGMKEPGQCCGNNCLKKLGETETAEVRANYSEACRTGGENGKRKFMLDWLKDNLRPTHQKFCSSAVTQLFNVSLNYLYKPKGLLSELGLKRAHVRDTLANAEEVAHEKCCKKDHLQKLTPEQIVQLRDNFFKKSRVEQDAFLSAWIYDDFSKELRVCMKTTKHLFGVCGERFCKISKSIQTNGSGSVLPTKKHGLIGTEPKNKLSLPRPRKKKKGMDEGNPDSPPPPQSQPPPSNHQAHVHHHPHD